ncbi:MAG: monovalent cation/H(+) antiporter subunit G [Oscillochloris sp.]|nr:monovalent cation/H(+) antiporter subunit G [Oscillochloris sp.]
MTLVEALTLIVLLIGVFFILVSTVGLVRLPDLYTRVHAAGKSGTLGIIGVLVGAGVFFISDTQVVFKVVTLIAFFFLTAPVAAHMLDRAAFLTGVEPMEGTSPNEIKGRYDRETRRLS